MNRNLSTLFLLVIFLTVFSFSNPAFSQELSKRQYKAAKVTVAPEIDGIIGDTEWSAGEWDSGFTQYEPYNGRESSQRTEFMILYDADNIYVAFKAYDSSPDSIVSRLTRRDSPDGDMVGIGLDSYHDLRTAFIFAVSASGVKYDLMMTNNGHNQDDSWNANWWAKTSINAEGWVAEMKIPFSQLRFEKDSDGIWGLELIRFIYRNGEQTFWQHIPKDAPGMVSYVGELTGLQDIKPRKVFDITPYGVVKAERFKAVPENPFLADGKKSGLNAGVDAKIGLTNNITMDLTINPDFGQVEADPSEVNLTAYETYFSEKRNFFIEGNNITSYNLGMGDGSNGNDNLFYSRRIGRVPQLSPSLGERWYADSPSWTTILGAAKVTGKTKNGLSIGVIEALTGNEYATVRTAGERTTQLVEPLTNYFVGRLQKDYNNGDLIIGGIITAVNRDLSDKNDKFLHKAAYTGGLDYVQYFNDKSWELSLSSAFSLVEGTREVIQRTQKSSARYYQRPDAAHLNYDPERTSLIGSGGRARLTKQDGHFNMMAAVIWKTPGFEINDLGYMQSADMVLSFLWGSYREWEPKSFYRNYSVNMSMFLANDFGGNILDKGLEYGANIGFKNYWSFRMNGNISGGGLSSSTLRGGPMIKTPGSVSISGGFSTDSRAKFEVSTRGNARRGFENSSKEYYIGQSYSYRPVKFASLSFEPGYSNSFSQWQYVTRKVYNGTDKYVFASINRKTVSASFRVNLNITPDMTFQYWGQPFVATGGYSDFKHITDPMADRYTDRFNLYSADQISHNDGSYYVDENIDGTVDYSFNNSDFHVREYLSNLMFRWEYSPGSTIYLVWSQSRDYYERSGEMDYFRNLGELFNNDIAFPHNVFLVKFSYRLGLR